MANFSSTYPSTRPVFNADFSNAGRLDSRITFSRSDTPPTYAAPSAVHYWSNEKHLSSENLNPNSEALTGTGYTAVNVTPTTGQADPSGGTNAVRFEQDSGQTTSGYVLVENQPSSGQFTYSFHAKANGKNYVVIQEVYTDSSLNETWFSISGAGGAGTTNANHSNVTVTKLGDWYRCSWTMTSTRVGYLRIGVADSDGSTTVTDSGGVYLYGLQRNTGSSLLDYQSTSGQIHREYAPTLKSVSTAGQPRFEYSPTDSASEAIGQSRGLLIEGSSTNLNPYSDSIASWNSVVQLSVDSNAAIGPVGSLSADLLRPTTNVSSHYARSVGITVSSGTSYTMSGYFKSVNGYRIRLVALRTTAPYTSALESEFTLDGDGSVTSTAGSGTIESVGNGWYFCTATGTTATTSVWIQLQTANASGVGSVAGDGYSGILCSGVQFELGSFASSLISTSGSQATRAADSASLVSSSLFTSGEHSVYWEGSVNGSTADPRLFALHNNSSTDRMMVDNNDGTKLRLNVKVSSTDFVLSETITAIPDNSKVVATVKANEARLVLNGTTTVTDTSTPISSGYSTLNIGSNYGGTNHLDGHVRRISYWNTALTETQAQAISS